MIRGFAALPIIAILTIASVDTYALEKTTIGNARMIVKTVTGTIEADLRRLKLLDDVYHNELIETKEDAATELVFLDETKLALGPNSSLTLDQFVYDPDPDKASFVMTATAGVFRFVSGKLPKKAYTIHTPTATIGVRGTALTIVVLTSGDGGGIAVNVTVDQGVAEITNCRGERVSLNRLEPSTTITGRAEGSCMAPTPPGPQPSEFAAIVANIGHIR